VQAAPVQAAPAQVATQQAPMPQIAMPQAPMPRTPMPQTEAVLPDQPTQGVPAIPIPQRNEFAVTGQIAPRPEPAKPGSARAEADPSEAAKAEPNRAEPGKPAAQKFVALKPVPSPPPLPKTPPPRQAQDPAQSVLARLRQMAPASPPAQPVAIPLPPADPRPRAAPSPSLPKLTAARAALASGRVEDARRLLQEVQLQLVFRPVNGGGDEAPSAGKGAADVAHALEALSGNDMPLSRRYIDVALDDLSGSGTIAPVQETQIRPSGYAPAYPPR
jgi:hypothetical protein